MLKKNKKIKNNQIKKIKKVNGKTRKEKKIDMIIGLFSGFYISFLVLVISSIGDLWNQKISIYDTEFLCIIVTFIITIYIYFKHKKVIVNKYTEGSLIDNLFANSAPNLIPILVSIIVLIK